VNRRDFLKLSAGAGIAALFQTVGIGCEKSPSSGIRLADLPYPADHLQPYISEKTVSLHFGRHQRGYVEKARRLAAQSPYADMTLAQVVTASAEDPSASDLFNAAAQVWNHQFYWESLAAEGGGSPQGELLAQIETRFGSYERFIDACVSASVGLFGSGWLWVVQGPDGLDILTTPNAHTPLTGELRPLLTVDLWEHAYYIDYHDRRDDYVRAVFGHLVNWKFAAENGGE
jgi:Fe-Mn family superoxide dismutase